MSYPVYPEVSRVVRWKSTSMSACTVLHSVQFLRAILSCGINERHFRVSQDSNLRNVFCVAPIGFPVTRDRKSVV